MRRTIALLLLLSLARLGVTGESPAVADTVALTVQEPELANPKADGGLLIRELARQALLIAARDELGLSTRDAALREPLDGIDGKKPALALKSEFVGGETWTLTVSRTGSGEQLWTKKIAVLPGQAPDYLALESTAAELSRKDFPEMLKAAGYTAVAAPGAGGATGPLAPEIETSIGKMSCFAQFTALRLLHEQIRKKGASPDALLGLVRGYANLGRLTSDQWTSATIAYRARALIYAERMAAASPQSAAALWARAYARAMAGYHGAALKDIEAAQKIEGALPAKVAEAGWGWNGALELYCRFDTEKLAAFADPSARELALFFRYLCAEHGSQGQTQEAVYAMLAANPECYCVYLSLWRIGGVSILHKATVDAPETFSGTLKRRLLEMPSLPDGVTAALHPTTADVAGRRARLVQAMVDAAAADRGEPSWAVPGRMIEEITFVQVAMRADFMKRTWGVDTTEFVQDSLPLVANHPYRAMIEALGLDAVRDKEKFRNLLKPIDIADVSYSERMLMDMTWNIDTPGKIQGRAAYQRAWMHADDAVTRIIWGQAPVAKAAAARELMLVSPHDPLAYDTLINHDWEFAQPHAADWEKEFARSAAVLGALGSRYFKMHALPDAERCMKAYRKLAADKWGYVTLADIYKDEGKIDTWQQTLDEYLEKVEDPGLQHAQVQVSVAHYYMSQKQWAKAEPYAAAAAQTWAAWAMIAARDCYEGMGDFKKAEVWQQRISERYENNQLDWYFWCKRTGEGDVKKATELAAQRFASIQNRETPADHLAEGVFGLLEDKSDLALPHFRAAFTATNNPWAGLQAALIADAAKNQDVRDQLLTEIGEKGPQYNDNGKPSIALMAVAALMKQRLAGGADTKFDLAGLDRAAAAATPAEQINIHFFAGRFLELHGTQEQALDYYDRAATGPDHQKWCLTLAAQALKRLGKKPGSIKRAPAAPEKPAKDEF